MNDIKLRLAKPRDAKQIADVQYSLRQNQRAGISDTLSKHFLTIYYKIVLNDPYEVIVCAENNKGEIMGFNSCTLDASKQMETFRRNRFRLGFAALSSIICKPSLIKPLFQRYFSLKKGSKFQFVNNEGARGEYWAWRITDKNPLASVEMNQAYRAILRALGVKEIFYEVDAINKKVVAYHKLNKDVIVDKILLPDGRERYLMKSDLTRKNMIKS